MSVIDTSDFIENLCATVIRFITSVHKNQKTNKCIVCEICIQQYSHGFNNVLWLIGFRDRNNKIWILRLTRLSGGEKKKINY